MTGEYDFLNLIMTYFKTLRCVLMVVKALSASVYYEGYVCPTSHTDVNRLILVRGIQEFSNNRKFKKKRTWLQNVYLIFALLDTK